LFTILLLQPVFFLRSRPTRRGKCERDGDGDVVRGPLQELALGRLALFVACPPMVEIMVTMTVEITTGGHASPRPPTC